MIYKPTPSILQRILKLTIGGVFMCLLSACGLKGSLYLPEPAPPQTSSQPANAIESNPPVESEVIEVEQPLADVAPITP